MKKQRCGNVVKPCKGALRCFFSLKNFENFTAECGLYEAETTMKVHFVKPRNIEERVQVYHQRNSNQW